MLGIPGRGLGRAYAVKFLGKQSELHPSIGGRRPFTQSSSQQSLTVRRQIRTPVGPILGKQHGRL
jgi:hypothetical protein